MSCSCMTLLHGAGLINVVQNIHEVSTDESDIFP